MYRGILQQLNFIGSTDYNERSFLLQLHQGTQRQLYRDKKLKKQSMNKLMKRYDMSDKEIADINKEALKILCVKLKRATTTTMELS